jgi:ABC-2 type transport system permease protein
LNDQERIIPFVQRADAVVEARELVRSLAAREIRGQYKGSLLGWFWSLLNPLAMVATYTLVFGVLFQVKPDKGDPSGLQNYMLYLVCGLIPWNLFATAITGQTGSLLAQSSLISKVYFPRSTVVVAKALSVAFTSVIEFAVVVIILLIAGNQVLPWLPLVALLFVLELILVLGFGLMLSVANVYFRDIQYLLTIGLQLLFYATPIIYKIDVVGQHGPRVLFVYRLNPLVRLVQAYRSVLYDLRWPAAADVAYVAVWAMAILALGMLAFRRLEGRLAEEL